MISALPRSDIAFTETGTSPTGATAFAIATFGIRIGVEIGAPDLADEALRRLPPGWDPVDWRDLDRTVRLLPIFGDRYRLRIDDELDSSETSREVALDTFESVIQHYVSEFATPWLFVHAGVVEWRGRAIVIPGRSLSGKSTLTKALVDAGATYLSDEYAVIGPDGLVRPYPRRLSLRDGPFGPAGRLDLRARAPGCNRAVPIGLVAALRFDTHAGWDIEEISRGQAVFAMCDNTVAVQRRPRDTLDYLNRALGGARAIRGTRGEAAESAELLLRLAETPVIDGRRIDSSPRVSRPG